MRVSNAQLKVFEKTEFGAVRIWDDPETGKTLFSGRDIATVLGYTNTRKAIKDHCKGVTKRYLPTPGGSQEMTLIPEGDVYRLITHSKLPSAQKFESWVFDEVLPSIRRDGYYINKQEMRLEMMENLLSGYKELKPNKAKFLNGELIQTLKDQIKVLRAENKKLHHSLRISEERATELENKLNDVQCNFLEQLINLQKSEGYE
nr:MAG TPA: repressor domain protein [Caudoviricetes sp.]